MTKNQVQLVFNFANENTRNLTGGGGQMPQQGQLQMISTPTRDMWVIGIAKTTNAQQTESITLTTKRAHVLLLLVLRDKKNHNFLFGRK